MKLSVIVRTALVISLAPLAIACTKSWIEDNPDYYPPYDNGRDPTGGGGKADGGGLTECEDPHGLGGIGCFKCEPTTNDQFLRACTTSDFESFDNKDRINNFDTSNRRPPLIDQGPTPPPFEGGEADPTDPLPPAPPCNLSAATTNHPVMVLGATGFPFDTIAKAMGTSATIYFLEKGSCDGVAGMLLNEPKLAAGSEVVYWNSTDGTKNRCVLQETHSADLTISALFAETCANQSGLADQVALPNNVADFVGPANPVMFAVPASSSEHAISAEAAYKVFGFGSKSGVSPWMDEQYIFRRRGSSGTQQTVALTLGLPPDGFRGRDSNGATNMLAALLSSKAPQITIGISSSEIVDVNRDAMQTLAYRHFGQPVAFYPDSNRSSLDRKNVRDGHYFMWMPLHVLSRTVGGEPVAASNPILEGNGGDTAVKQAERNAAVKRLAYVMVHRQEAPVKTVDLFTALKKTGNVPQCAMHVSRKREGAPLEPFKPTAPCDCAFEAATPGTTSTECKVCKASLDCPSSRPNCSFGYCEP